MKGILNETLTPRRAARVFALSACVSLAVVAHAQTTGHEKNAAHHNHGGTRHEGHEAALTAHDDGIETAAPEELIRRNSVNLSLPDVDVLDQDGRPLRFHTDLVKGKVVLVSFIYTTCVFTCTTQGKSLASLQKLLGERLGREVTLLTVSTDPETDMPAKLKKWGAAFGARDGWIFVTGETAAMERLRKAFPGVRAGRDTHESLIFIGNDARRLWVRADGQRPTREILSLLEAVAATNSARVTTTAVGHHPPRT
jgi:protein SCO1